MRRTVFLSSAVAVLVLALALGVAWATPDFDPIKKIEARKNAVAAVENYRAEIASNIRAHLYQTRLFGTKSGKAGNPAMTVYTFVHFDADESAGTLDTITELTIEAREDGITEAELSVQVLDGVFMVEDGSGTPLTHTHNELYNTVTVTLQTTLNTGEQMDLVVYNSGDPQCGPDDFFGMEFCGVTTEIVFFTGADFIPTSAAYTYDDLYSGGPIDIDISVPAGYIAATTADQDGPYDDLGAEWVYHFVNNFDATYFGFAYSEFDTFTKDTLQGITVTDYIYTGTLDYGQDWADTSADIIDFFEGIYSPYIYNKHDVIQVVQELGGGVGPQSATFYYAGALNNNPENFTSESLFSHEIAHQWWGNMIRMGDSVSPWLNEGFAEYSSRLYGYTWWPDYYQEYLYEMYFEYFRMTVDPEDEPAMSSNDIFYADMMAYQAVTYWKGSHFLRMLEWYLGQDVLLDALFAYSTAYSSDNSDETVTVNKFKTLLEAETGEDFDGIFDRWVYGTGYPVYEWAAQFEETKGGYTARIRAEQIQEIDTVFELPLEVGLWIGEDDDPTYFTLEFDGKVADETFELEEEPRGVSVDRRSWIWGQKIPALVGDVDGSNDVDGVDLIYTAWSQGGMAMDWDHWNYISECDYNRDGTVDDADLALLSENFGKRGTIDD